MPYMVVTWLVSHMEMASLNVFLLENNPFILVMLDVHQVPMGYPYVAPIAQAGMVLQSSLMYAATASLNTVLSVWQNLEGALELDGSAEGMLEGMVDG
jgi:hypothetical protein